jgi:hypothetical protein
LEPNIDAIRAGYEHFNRTGGIDPSQFAPDAELDASTRVFDAAVYRGHEEIGSYFDSLREIWESQVLEPISFEVVDDKVVVAVSLTTIGKGSGVETSAQAGHVWTVKSDKVVRLQIFQSHDEALEAARA